MWVSEPRGGGEAPTGQAGAASPAPAGRTPGGGAKLGGCSSQEAEQSVSVLRTVKAGLLRKGSDRGRKRTCWCPVDRFKHTRRHIYIQMYKYISQFSPPDDLKIDMPKAMSTPRPWVLAFKHHFPVSGTRGPWRNGGLQGWEGKCKISLEYFIPESKKVLEN